MTPEHDVTHDYDDVMDEKPNDWIQCPNCKGWDERWQVEGAECCIQKAKDEAEDAYYET